MRRYENNPKNPMLNRAILELNGVFNIKQQPQAPKTVPLQRQEECKKEYVHPILTRSDFNRTMENYRQAVDKYNEKVVLENRAINQYNNKVDALREKKPVPRIKLLALSGFYKMISPLNTWERNKRVEEYNRCNGEPIAKKDRIQTIKYHTEQIFQAILWHYNQQLFKRKDLRNKLSIHIAGEMPFVQLHSGWITTAKVNEVTRLKISNRTFRRQRERLEEAGILQDYTFEGSARPVKMRINPEILCLTDNAAPKKAATENQSFTSGGRTECPHNNVSNRSFSYKEEIKANVEKHSGERSSAKGLTSLNFSSIGNTRSQHAEKNDAAAEKNQGRAKNFSLSQYLRQRLEEKTDFAEQLAAHQYDNYSSIRIEILQKEAYSGSLSREEFKELVLQDFFKTSAKLWRGTTPYQASWLKAYNTWMRDKFRNFTGLDMHKHTLVERIPELRYRLAAAGRWLQKHKDYNLLFPGEYFNPTRTTAKEGGFRVHPQSLDETSGLPGKERF